MLKNDEGREVIWLLTTALQMVVTLMVKKSYLTKAYM
jgi:hypothetical protein